MNLIMRCDGTASFQDETIRLTGLPGCSDVDRNREKRDGVCGRDGALLN